MSPMVRRSLTIEHALLGFLKQGALHGYQLHQQICAPDGLGRVWHLKQPHLYALLDRLEQQGYITSSLKVQSSRPSRRVYQLTASGEIAFMAWLTSPVQTPRQMRQEFQLKLFFARRESQDLWLGLLDVQRIVCQGWLTSRQSQVSETSTPQSYAWLVDRYRIGQIKAMLDWLEICARETHQGE